MEGSKRRVRAILNGERPDRIPLYELIRNDRVIEHFSGSWPTPENGEELVFRMFPRAVDATRPALKAPMVPVGAEREEILPDGRRRVTHRWTAWTERIRYTSSEAYAQAKRTFLASASTDFTEEDRARVDAYIEQYRTYCRRLGDDFFLFMSGPGAGLMGICGEVTSCSTRATGALAARVILAALPAGERAGDAGGSQKSSHPAGSALPHHGESPAIRGPTWRSPKSQTPMPPCEAPSR